MTTTITIATAKAITSQPASRSVHFTGPQRLNGDAVPVLAHRVSGQQPPAVRIMDPRLLHPLHPLLAVLERAVGARGIEELAPAAHGLIPPVALT